MENYKKVIYCSISYRRNIKDMPFAKVLTDFEQAIGVSRSMSEILGDDFEIKLLKNISIEDCKKLIEQDKISGELVDNKDISAFGKNMAENTYVYINGHDHIQIKSVEKGFDLEKCYNRINQIDDKILDKLEIAFSTTYGFLTSNPYLCGTGMEIEVLMFLPALCMDKKLEQVAKELLKNEFELLDINNEQYKNGPFVKIKNRFTFGYKENEFADKTSKIVQKILNLESIEENNLFDLSASGLVDTIFRQYGIGKNAYRTNFDEAVGILGFVLWGTQLNVLRIKKQFDIFDILCTIKENHINSEKLNLKEIEKKRAKILNSTISNCIEKGEVDV